MDTLRSMPADSNFVDHQKGFFVIGASAPQCTLPAIFPRVLDLPNRRCWLATARRTLVRTRRSDGECRRIICSQEGY